MNGSMVKLSVFFDDPFWVGVFERIGDGTLSVCRVTFGAEPKDYEVWDFVLSNYYGLKFSPAGEIEARQSPDNYKRRVREAGKQVHTVGIGTKAQQALAAQREALKTERKNLSRQRREDEQQRRFELRQKKRKEKHRGH